MARSGLRRAQSRVSKRRGFTHQFGRFRLPRKQQAVRVNAVFPTEIHDQVEAAVSIDVSRSFDVEERLIDEAIC